MIRKADSQVVSAQEVTGNFSKTMGNTSPGDRPYARSAMFHGSAIEKYAYIQVGESELLMRSWWNRSRWWLRLACVALVGIAIGLVVAIWAPVGMATALGGAGGVGAAVAGAIAVRVQSEFQRRVQTMRNLPGSIEIAPRRGRFPLVSDLANPVEIGVHPAEALETDDAADRVPSYVTRDIDPRLRSALERDSFVLVVGESAAGKTRAAFEAMRAILSSCHFVSPASRQSLAGLVTVLAETTGYVIWLDDFERYLGPAGLTLSLLRQLQSGHGRTVVLGTMRSHEYARYRDRVEGEMGEAERDGWREGRAVVRQANVLHLQRLWTKQEKSRAQEYKTDRRIAGALSNADRFGVCETLAAGPELAELWRDAWTPGHHPRAAALVSAAVDARRAGYHEPLPLNVLERMHSVYLEERGGPELRPESLDEAIRWASVPTFPHGANSLLIGTPEHGYRAFDYLIDLPGDEVMPSESWTALIESIPGPDAFMLGEYAIQRGHAVRAIGAYRRASEDGVPHVDVMLADFGVRVRPASESLQTGKAHVAQLKNECGPDCEETILAENSVVNLMHEMGDVDGAFTLSRELKVRSERMLPPGNRTRLSAEFNYACMRFYADNAEEGIAELDSAIANAESALGPLDTAVTSRKIIVVNMIRSIGLTDEARARLSALSKTRLDLPNVHITATWLDAVERNIENDIPGELNPVSPSDGLPTGEDLGLR